MRASSRKVVIAAIGLVVLGFITYRSRSLFHFADFSGARLLDFWLGCYLYLLAFGLVACYGCFALRALRGGLFQRLFGAAPFWRIFAMPLGGFSLLPLLGGAVEDVNRPSPPCARVC